jgi:serine/threonine protein kinase
MDIHDAIRRVKQDIGPLDPLDPPALDDYRLIGKFRSGHANEVFLAQREGVKYVVKRPTYADGEPKHTAVGRYRREWQAGAQLRDSPYFARVVTPKGQSSSGQAKDEFDLFMIQEFVDGPTLANVMEIGGDGRPEFLLELATSLLRALRHLRRKKITHRDIKPVNICLRPDFLTPVVIDFHASLIDDGLALTASDTIVCTARYAAPEQLAGQLATNESDLFSWGTLIAQYAAFGAHPFGVYSDELYRSIQRKHREVTPLLDGLSGPLANAVRAALNVDDPSARRDAYHLLDSTARIRIDDDPDETERLRPSADGATLPQPSPDDPAAAYLLKVHDRTLRLLSRALS